MRRRCSRPPRSSALRRIGSRSSRRWSRIGRSRSPAWRCFPARSWLDNGTTGGRSEPSRAPGASSVRAPGRGRIPTRRRLVFGVYVIYGELDRRANRLAHRLIRLGVGPFDLVGMSARRSPSSRRGAVGRFEGGRGLSAARSRHPAKRQVDTHADAGVRFVLADAASRDRLTESAVRFWCLAGARS